MATQLSVRILLAASLFMTAHGQLIDRSEIEDGGSFNLTCDVSRIGSVPAAVTVVYYLSIERTVASGTLTTIALYSPSLSQNLTKTIPDNRPWVIEASGGKGFVGADNNRASIQLTLYVPDAQCADAGLYSCNASYPQVNGVSMASRSQQMTSKAKAEVPVINNDHHNGIEPNYSPNPEGQSLTLTCSVLGPKSIVLKWQYRATDGFNLVDYPFTNDIKVSDPLLVPGTTCGQYRLESALTLTVQSQEIVYVCAVLDGNYRVTETNFTIGIQTDGTSSEDSGLSYAHMNSQRLVGNMFLLQVAVFLCLSF